MKIKELQIKQRLKKLTAFASAAFILMGTKSHAQCIATTNSPTGTITVSPYVQTCLSSNMFPGSYTSFSVTSTGQYAILTSFGTQVTVTDNANNPLAFGFGSALYTGILTPGVYRVHIHNTAGCSISGGSRIVCVAPRNNAFSFDGVNDYVDLGTAITSSLTGKDRLTVEAWVYPNSNTGVHSIVGNHQGPTQFELRTNGTNFNFFIGFGAFGVTSVATVTLNTWTHVAGVFDQNKLSIYVNGMPSGTVAVSSFSFPVSSVSTKIGLDGFSSEFDGAIDEVRIWNRALCQGEILNNKNGPIPTTNSGLIANYHFNQGVAGGSNPTVTSLVDDSGNGINGTIMNAALTGAVSNWIGSGSYPDNGSIIPFVSPNISITGTTSVCSGSSATLTANGASTYTWVSGPTTAANVISPTVTTTYSVTGTNSLGCVSNMAQQTVSVNALPSVTVNSGSICSGFSFTMVPTGASTYSYSSGSAVVSPTATTAYTVTGTNAQGCSADAVSNVTVNICAAAEALNFVSTAPGDKVVLPTAISTSLSTNNNITVEAWVKPTSLSGLGCIVGNYSTPNNQMQFLLRRELGTNYRFWIGNSATATYTSVASSATPTLNVWQHVAGVWNGTVASIYINGVLSGTASITYPSFVATSNSVTIGGNGINENFNGDIDEIRLWNRALCQGEIVNNMNGEIATNANGLMANYHFNQGLASQSNSSITSLTDATSNSFNGTLTGFALTGSTSNWIAPGAVSVTATPFTSPTVTINGNNSICVGSSDTLTANGNVTSYSWVSGPTTSVNIVTPTVTTTYSVSGLNSGCPSNMAVFTVTVNNLPTVTATTGNTIICGPPFQGTATLTANGASTYTWNTSANGSSIAVSPSVTTTYTVTGTDANGCANTAVVTQSVSTCTGIDGSKSIASQVKIYPNPNNGFISVELPYEAKMEIINVLGQAVYSETIIEGKNEINLSALQNGVYFIKLSSSQGESITRIIKQ
ncbi:MAG: T9SS type A sorting domain-containing protein [Bacteroidetes bacterium]|nr:T9SS type A sorting domain-containing protein [Bacteroidota bacterium]